MRSEQLRRFLPPKPKEYVVITREELAAHVDEYLGRGGLINKCDIIMGLPEINQRGKAPVDRGKPNG